MNLEEIEKKLDVVFNNKDLIMQSLVHRSYLNEHSDFKLDHNERLEFLGDAVLELSVTHYLYNNFPNPEGELTNWRSSLVRAETLSEVARDLEIEKGLLLSRGEQKSVGRARDVILANALEAVIGAIYLDQGYLKADCFIQNNIISRLPEILKQELYIDPKSKFQEVAQEKEGITPVYRVLKENGPDHAKVFTVGVFLGERELGQGEGPSKQIAQQMAAKKALLNY
jgi:ribonuclease III